VTAGLGQPVSVERVEDEISITPEQIQQLDKSGKQSYGDTRVAASALETIHDRALLHDALPHLVDMAIGAIELLRVKAEPFLLSDEERSRSDLLGMIGFLAELVRIAHDVLLGRKIAHAEISIARHRLPTIPTIAHAIVVDYGELARHVSLYRGAVRTRRAVSAHRQ
jgi:hypothetical protein